MEVIICRMKGMVREHAGELHVRIEYFRNQGNSGDDDEEEKR